MKRLLLCALILTSCTSGKTTKVAAVKKALFEKIDKDLLGDDYEL